MIDPPAKFAVPEYYGKFSWAREFILLSHDAPDDALLRANRVIRRVFAYRHDVLKALINADVRLVILGSEETLHDLPEWPALQAAGFAGSAREARFHPETGRIVVSADAIPAERSDLSDDGHPIIGRLIDAAYQLTASRPIDPNWEHRGRDVQQYEIGVQRLDERFGVACRNAYQAAQAAGKWRDTSIEDERAYFTAGVLAYFDAAGPSLRPCRPN